MLCQDGCFDPGMPFLRVSWKATPREMDNSMNYSQFFDIKTTLIVCNNFCHFPGSGSDITLKINVEFQQKWSKSTADVSTALSPFSPHSRVQNPGLPQRQNGPQQCLRVPGVTRRRVGDMGQKLDASEIGKSKS